MSINLKEATLNVDKNEDLLLWNAIIKDNEKSFSLLFKKYFAVLVGYGNSFSPNSEKVSDCVQDVFADLWIYRKSLNETVAVKAYLLSCVRNRIARMHKKDKVFQKTNSLDSVKFLFDFSIEHHLIADETTANKVAHLNKSLNSLPARQKEALYLRYHQALDVEQIASTLGVNYQSATNLLYRALQNLREQSKGYISVF